MRPIELVLSAKTLSYGAEVLSCLSEAGLYSLENLLPKSVSVLLGHLTGSRNKGNLRTAYGISLVLFQNAVVLRHFNKY